MRYSYSGHANSFLAVQIWRYLKRAYCKKSRGTGLQARNRLHLLFLRLQFFALFLLAQLLLPLATFASQSATVVAENKDTKRAVPSCERMIFANVVALEQVYTYNRFGSFNPAGMMFALRRDVVANEDINKGNLHVKEGKFIPPNHSNVNDQLLAGNVRLRTDKRPRPLVLRVNEGDCLEVTFTNLLSPTTNGQEVFNEPLARLMPDQGDVKDDVKKQIQAMPLDSEEPRTRHASMHVNGLDYVGGICPGGYRAAICADGANVGNNPSSLAAPGKTAIYTWYAKKEGAYLLYSMAGPIGGEGDGGQLGLGLFGSINVEPRGSISNRSQVTHDELEAAINHRNGSSGLNPNGTPIIDYLAQFPSGAPHFGDPVLSMVKPIPSVTKKCSYQDHCEIIYSDLNAIISLPRDAKWSEHDWRMHYGCSNVDTGSSCGESFREFTSIFHDEITAVQAFPELEDESNTLNRVKDGMAINYGSASMGSAVLASRKGIGPAAHCAECKLEEFFLSSWANGDPAMLVERDPKNTLKAVNALYPDDPSNVHHSYIGDAVRFRNLHAGPKETHVFHLHAHQWVRNDGDENSTYLDSQTVSPGASFSYEIYYGGSGNRNLTPGDSIFHCHLYPHFAQGMWELWRSHDVFEAGTTLDIYGRPKFGSRALPDGEISQGTPIPAIVPVPGLGMPPMPTEAFKGYPFYIAGQPGHRPPQAPLDLVVENGEHLDGGLPRHRILDGSVVDGIDGVDEAYTKDLTNVDDLYYKGRKTVNETAKRVRTLSAQPELFGFARKLESARIELLPLDGTPSEKNAMAFHEALGQPLITTKNGWQARSYPSFDSSGAAQAFLVNGKSAKPGAPYADPCPIGKTMRKYKAAYIQFDMTVNKAGWHDPQARIAVLQEDVKPTLDNVRPPEPLFIRANSDECISFEATNLVPSALNVDDFQLFSPTDIIGQHIHLVKFDVTASDGSENGWNYEDGTYSPDEVRERIDANNKYQASFGGTQILRPKAQAFFTADKFSQAKCGLRNAQGNLLQGQEDGPWCGAQTTAQRWWADPLLNSRGEDRTLRTVFTHDHFGPSSHQHHGLYAALVIEPKQSEWQKLDGTPFGGTSNGAQLIKRPDGGPTSYAANIVLPAPNEDKSHREFNLAFADFAIVYDENNKPISGPQKIERDLPTVVLHPAQPRPESISAGDPGTQLLNYRNEPIPLRIAKAGPDGTLSQDSGDRGDMANVFSSETHKNDFPTSKLQFSKDAEPPGVRLPGDPGTPLLSAYEGDTVQLRLVQGAQEENHVFTMNGVKWLSQPQSPNTGYMNAQHIGISEHFEFDVKFAKDPNIKTDYLYSSSATDNLWDGMWGILRAFPFDKNQEGLHPIGSARDANKQAAKRTVCPTNRARVDRFFVSAWLAREILPGGELQYNRRFGITDPNAILFVEDPVAIVNGTKTQLVDRTEKLNALKAAYADGSKIAEPLMLRAAANDCIDLILTNHLPISMPDDPRNFEEWKKTWSYNMLPPITDGFNFNQVRSSSHVSLHPQLLATSTYSNDGALVGNNEDSTVAPDESWTYHWYAGEIGPDGKGIPIEFGVTALRDMADVIKHTSHGAIGAIVVEPQNSKWDETCGQNSSKNLTSTNAMKDVCDATGKILFRDFVLLYQDDLSLQRAGDPMANLRNGDDAEDSGQKAFNYRTEPIWARLGAGGPATGPDAMSNYDFTNAFSSKTDSKRNCAFDGISVKPCDPDTPLFTAIAGRQIRFRVVHPGGHPRNHAFTLFGHNWESLPWTNDSKVMGHNPQSDVVGSTNGIGPARHVNIVSEAGGAFAVPGDYMYRTQEGFMFGGGLWGILRVECATGDSECIKKKGKAK